MQKQMLERSGSEATKQSVFVAPHSDQVADALSIALRDLGVRQAFGVCGGAQALLWVGLSRHLEVTHFRHESGAGFAAGEASLASDRPVAVFVTTGPGITNALTGVTTARTEGAKVILVSAYSTASHRGRGGIQETSGHTMPTSGLFEAGSWFDDALILESAEQLPQLLRRLANGFARPGGYAAHVSVPSEVQAAALARPLVRPERVPMQLPVLSDTAAHEAATTLASGRFVIWAGFGARRAYRQLRDFVERTGAPVLCSPRAKGVFPENDPLFIGVTGMGGHAAAVGEFMRHYAPERILVLGSRLSQPTSFWSPSLVPSKCFVHVDTDPSAFGVGYPDVPTIPLVADVGLALWALKRHWRDERGKVRVRPARPHPKFPAPNGVGRIRPEALLGVLQDTVVDRSDAIVLAESGNAFTWGTHFLRFDMPGRYRVSTNLGPMGHAATGVVGAALAAPGGAVALVGDGAMLMANEVNTAVKRNASAVWIVLNDGRYNMCHQGMQALDMEGLADAAFPPVDFAALARAQGAKGIRVEREADLAAAIEKALTGGPAVVDVLIDPDRRAPSQGRNEGLARGGASMNPDARNVQTAASKPLSFPLTSSD